MKLLDLHCDTISECWKNNWDLLSGNTSVTLHDLPVFEKWI